MDLTNNLNQDQNINVLGSTQPVQSTLVPTPTNEQTNIPVVQATPIRRYRASNLQEPKIKEVDVPNELKIIIHTSIPGFQKILYRPNMTNPKLDKNEKTVYFTPFVKLKNSYINSIPPDIRVKQFFNKGYFQ